MLPTCSQKVTRYTEIRILYLSSSYCFFLCLSISFFLSIFFLFHLSNYLFSKNPPSFFLPCSFFCPFLPPLSFICLFCSILLPVLPLLTSLFSEARVLFLLQNRPFRLCRPPRPWFYRLFSECKAAKQEIAHKPQSSASGKNDWCCTSLLPICLHDVDKDHFTFFYLLQHAPTNARRSLGTL